MLKLLSFPRIPDDIVSQIRSDADLIWTTNDPFPNTEFMEAYGNSSNENFIERFVDPAYVNEELHQFVKGVLGLPSVRFGLILMKNAGTTPAIFPAHTDYFRNLGLNVLLTDGGGNVETSTYKTPVSHTTGKLAYWQESQLTLTDTKVIKEGEWYAFNAQAPHGIKNIETKRLVLMIFPFSFNITFDKFTEFYKGYIR